MTDQLIILWAEIEKYKDIPNISIFKKENGGKHTALNFWIRD